MNDSSFLHSMKIRFIHSTSERDDDTSQKGESRERRGRTTREFCKEVIEEGGCERVVEERMNQSTLTLCQVSRVKVVDSS